VDRLEHLALTDLDARRKWIRQLARRDDERGRLLELSLEPDACQWLEINDLLDACDDAAATWLSPFLSHWDCLHLNHPDLGDPSRLSMLTHLEDPSLEDTARVDLSPLPHLTP